MILTASCDDCGVKLTTEQAYRDYDNVDRCELCHLECELGKAINEYKDLQKWLEATHLKDLAKLKTQVDKLKGKIDLLRNGHRVEA